MEGLIFEILRYYILLILCHFSEIVHVLLFPLNNFLSQSLEHATY